MTWFDDVLCFMHHRHHRRVVPLTLLLGVHSVHHVLSLRMGVVVLPAVLCMLLHPLLALLIVSLKHLLT
jgi:hypothetical protein